MKNCWILPSNTTHFFGVHPEDPVGAQGIAQYKSVKNTKFLQFNSSWGHFYTKLLNSILFFHSYLKGAPQGPPTAPRMDPMEMGQKQKVLRIILLLGSFLWKIAEFFHLIPLISLGCTLRTPWGPRGGPCWKVAFIKTSYIFDSAGVLFMINPQILHFLWIPFWGTLRTLGAQGLTVSKRGI